MANNANRIIDPMEFHPGDTPRGMEYYTLEILTPQQQEELNLYKINTIRENQKYLFEHPEVRKKYHKVL